jgi:hypothetical protein
MRSQKTQDWVKNLPIATGLVNQRPLRRIGNLSPGSINTLVDDVKIRQAIGETCLYVPPIQNYKEQNLQQKKYEKSGKFHIGDYVYLDYKETTFAKSFDLKVSYFYIKFYLTTFSTKEMLYFELCFVETTV